MLRMTLMIFLSAADFLRDYISVEIGPTLS